MVRKRTRRYESDDNDSDSDVDFDFETKPKPAAKRYSLRERKRTLFTSDFDYYGLDEEEGEAKKPSSDDEDFEVEDQPSENNGVIRTYYEPDPEAIPENPEGLIDFEDIIRADIVVNKSKIDYDNMIQKTEIKLTQPKKKRGRPPKTVKEEEEEEEEEEAETKIECQPDLEASLQNQEYERLEDIETKRENMETSEAQEGLPNGVINQVKDNLSKNISHLQEPLVGNNLNDEQTQYTSIQDLNEEKARTTEEDEDDDVIVLGEVKQPVIVLDD